MIDQTSTDSLSWREYGEWVKDTRARMETMLREMDPLKIKDISVLVQDARFEDIRKEAFVNLVRGAFSRCKRVTCQNIILKSRKGAEGRKYCCASCKAADARDRVLAEYLEEEKERFDKYYSQSQGRIRALEEELKGLKENADERRTRP
tara:strand:+ start:866 stop:1312 length:447 start_codon:yes stop_codon:yes gene_type:complete